MKKVRSQANERTFWSLFKLFSGILELDRNNSNLGSETDEKESGVFIDDIVAGRMRAACHS
ncbi:hypothetical protein IV38_GL001665 [Lactobacillus selangorensis]|uniref:Uncharacterized protein n=1 Tax=Lactobacillus selangorensis TaxID=81857 RepID=A0A0R2FR47_9LACO|nr:hypothetical protein IV38_GL001665 [Lactobacillus selangorensis]KRN30913.1 hypothetical protein IV40_GL001550 [Lactobacillus selangorensis]